MKKTIQVAFGLLTPARKRELWGVALLSAFGSVAELASLGAILPFLAMLAEPAKAQSIPILGQFLERLSAVSGASSAAAAASLFIGVILVSAIVRIFLVRRIAYFAHGAGHDLSVRVHDRILQQPYTFHVASNSSELLSSVEKVGRVVDGVLLATIDGIVAVLLAVSIVVGLLIVDWATAVIAGVLFGVSYWIVSRLSKVRMQRNGELMAAGSTERIKKLQESVGGIRDVLLDGSGPLHVSRFAMADQSVRTAQADTLMWSQVPRYGVEALGIGVIASLSVMATIREGGIGTALPTLGALALGAQRLLPLFQRCYQSWNGLQSSVAPLLDVARFASLPEREGPRHGEPALLPFHHAIELRGLGFRYTDATPWVFKHLDLRIPKGACVGIAGETGCGKSTLLDLFMGLLTAHEGELLIDGVALTSLNNRHWQARIAHVPQSIFLADATLAENVAFGESKEQIDMLRVTSAAQRARIHDYINSLEQGYDTRVGERGVRLSGGQRQRIGIARALYRSADVIVLDEATSALDGTTESLVMEQLNSLGTDVTLFIVAHRLSTLASCDLILRLAPGELVSVEQRALAVS